MPTQETLPDMNPGTLGKRFEDYNNRTSGFDYLRITLALAVMSWHAVDASYGIEFSSDLQTTPIGNVVRMLLPMFFALSGFLVAGSLFRTASLFVFASHRVFRIFPALIVEVVLSAFIFGALVTSLSTWEYFTDLKFYRYLFNAIGWIYFYLPGVFTENPVGWTNISLWTVPLELECYVALIALAYFMKAHEKPKFFIALTIGLHFAMPGIDYLLGSIDDLTINRVHPRLLVLSFLAGVSIYLFRGLIPLNWPLFIVSGLVAYGCATNAVTSYLLPFPIAYFTIFIGLQNIPRLPIIFNGDYSYGMYLYAFPFQQLYSYLFPENLGWWQNMAFAVPSAAVFAAFSWHCIEKPILMHRKTLVAKVEGAWQRLRNKPSQAG